MTRLLGEHEYSEASRIAYDFVWSEFCDWYIEIAKIQLRDASEIEKSETRRILYRVLEDCLKLLHPLMPYVTEAIWDNLPNRSTMLIAAEWPKPGSTDAVAEAELELAIGITRAIRNIRSEFKVDAGRRIPAGIVAGDQVSSVERQRRVIETLARVNPLDIVDGLPARPKKAIHALVEGVELYLPLAGLVDLDAERSRAATELTRIRGQIEAIDRRIAEPSFIAKAPRAVVEKERERRSGLLEQLHKLEERRTSLDEP